jgi:hypothetical protein
MQDLSTSINDESINTKRISFWERLVGVIISPKETMEDLVNKPRVLFPFFIVAFGSLIFYLIRLPLYKEMINRSLELQLQESGSQFSSGQSGFIQNVGIIGGLIGTSIASLVIWLIVAFAFFLLIKVFKGEGKFKQYLSILGYSYVINALYLMISLFVSYFSNNLFFDSSIASIVEIFAPNLKGSLIYGVLRGIDLFGIWQYIVISLGMASLSKISKEKVYLITALIYTVSILLNADNMSNM